MKKARVFYSESQWRDNHWEKSNISILTKTKDWKYEKEYRLILQNGENKMKYNFQNLKGLIFAIKTPEKEKLQIIEIIKNKCKKNNRNNFEFFQAYYCHKNKNIQHKKMGI